MRYFLVWFAIFAAIHVYRYVLSTFQKKEVRFHLRQFLVSAAVSTLIVFALYSINNISGI